MTTEGYSLGIDFGSAGTIVSYMENNDVISFKINQDREYIPSAVFIYNEEEIFIGQDALELYLFSDGSEGEFYSFFKMYLPLEDKQNLLENAFWQGEKKPTDIAKIFFDKLLISDRNSFKNSKSFLPKNIVLSVPELWHKDPRNPGAIALVDILKNKLGLPLDRLVSEPVAALAFIKWRLERENKEVPRYVLVCDMGSGTFDVSFCEIKNDEISVKYFNGAGQSGIGVGGYRFDIEVIKDSWEKNFRSKPNINSIEFKKILYKFEDKKKNSGFWKSYERRKNRGYPIDLDGFKIYPSSIDKAFNILESVMAETLKEFSNILEIYPNYYVLTVGGFSRIPLFEKKLKEILKISDDRFIPVSIDDKYLAISKGCALIASGKVKIIEKFPHSVGIIATDINRGERKKVYIIEENVPREKLEKGIFSGTNFRILDRENFVNVNILLKIDGKNEIKLEKKINIPKEYRNKPVKLGFRVDRSNLLHLLVQDKYTGKTKEFYIKEIIDSDDIIIER